MDVGVDAKGVGGDETGPVDRRAVGDDEALPEVDVLAACPDRDRQAAGDRPLEKQVIEEDFVPVEGPVLGGQVNPEFIRDLAQEFEVLRRLPIRPRVVLFRV